MKLILVMLAMTVSTLANANTPNLTNVIPPQFECSVVDSDGMTYSGGDVQKVSVRTFDDFGAEHNLLPLAESAMKDCMAHSSNPLSCDLVSCQENPQ